MRSLVTRATRSETLDPHVASCRVVGGVEEHLTVGRVAGLAGVTVRTLHHYDEIGLARPSARTAAGHRAYSRGATWSGCGRCWPTGGWASRCRRAPPWAAAPPP